jgi:hypothetical protein
LEEKMSKALEMMNETILALEAEGYEFTAKTLRRSSTYGPQENSAKQVLEVRCYKRLPAEEIPPEFKALNGFSEGMTC